MNSFPIEPPTHHARHKSVGTLCVALLLFATICAHSTYAAVTFQGNVTPAPPGAGGSVVAPFIIGDVAGGSMSIEIAGPDPVDGFGQVAVGATATVAGTLNVELVDGFEPSLGDSFQILSAGSRTGFFASEDLPALGRGLVWDVNYNSDSIVLNVVNPVGNTGDYNDDGIVDAADYVVWRKFNNTSTTLPNDPSAGSVNDGDYDNWHENFGQAGGAGGATAVPEPEGPSLASSRCSPSSHHDA
jgi:hypothetical protein